MIENQALPFEKAEEILAASGEVEKQVRNLQKLLKDLPSLQSDLRKLRQRLEQLSKLPLPPGDLAQQVVALCSQGSAWLTREERQRPLLFGGQLRAAAQELEIACEPLTSDPPTLRLAPFTVELNYARDRARLDYARIPLEECSLDVQQILDIQRRWLQRLDTPFEAGAYLEALFRAYRRYLELHQMAPGDRVDLVDLIADLTMLLQPKAFRDEPTRENFQPYGRAQLAFDLARLRRAGKLEYKGFRLTLGTATVGSTRDKKRVVFLEEGGRGQYYLSISFVSVKS